MLNCQIFLLIIIIWILSNISTWNFEYLLVMTCANFKTRDIILKIIFSELCPFPIFCQNCWLSMIIWILSKISAWNFEFLHIITRCSCNARGITLKAIFLCYVPFQLNILSRMKAPQMSIGTSHVAIVSHDYICINVKPIQTTDEILIVKENIYFMLTRIPHLIF